MKRVFYLTHEPSAIDVQEKRLNSELHRCGQSYQYADNVYILTTDLTLREIYSILKPYLSEHDRIFGL